MRRSLSSRAAVMFAGAMLALGGAGTVFAGAAHAGGGGGSGTPGTTATTLPLFGASLTVSVTTGPGGAIADVSVDPADGLTATKVDTHRVTFENADGTAKVKVGSGHGGQGVAVKAGTLADVSGPGHWSGDVFGDGTTTTVDFTVGPTADGAPDITGISSSDATAVIGEVKHFDGSGHGWHHWGDDDSTYQAASVRVKFDNGSQARWLGILVEVRTNGDESTAKLGVGLSALRGVAQDAATAAGAKTWTGVLCDGSTATINYNLAEDGTISDLTATPEPLKSSVNGNHADVRFSDSERVKIFVKARDGQLKIDVQQKFRCDSPDPTINGQPAPTTTDPGVDDDGGKHHDGGNWNGGWGNGGGDGHRGGHNGGGDDRPGHDD